MVTTSEQARAQLEAATLAAAREGLDRTAISRIVAKALANLACGKYGR